MKLELFPFQTEAQRELRRKFARARNNYEEDGEPQIISFTAPTGSGKTVMMAAFVESVYRGDEKYAAQPDAIFVWLSDSPELNKQSANKFRDVCDGIDHSQLVMIDDESFDRKTLDDGKIYFLNTQKLGKGSNLTRHSDKRQFTIWETLQHTIDEKSERLCFIIDEAHRGMRTGRASALATTIMQKFIKGSAEDGLSPAPSVIGMSATIERFNVLAEGTSSTVHRVIVKVEDVRVSGLLKERIVIVHPDEREKRLVTKDMAMLEAAADEWKDKCDRWRQYCRDQHKKSFNPIFIVQVLNGSGARISETDLNECLKRISDRAGVKFEVGEVVHTFGQTASDLMINGLRVVFEEPARIADCEKIKVVFFKENLSTGWDCPRAETMMSFRRATDATYIAQLLGRMIRTPLQCRIEVDETLNEVRLFLPHFDRETARSIADELQNSEGEIPTDVTDESVGEKKFDTWTVNAPLIQFNRAQSDQSRSDRAQSDRSQSDRADRIESSTTFEENFNPEELEPEQTIEPKIEKKIPSDSVRNETAPKAPFDRKAIVEAINQTGLLTYRVRSKRINDYLKSLMKLAELLVRNALDREASDEIKREVAKLIREYVETLKQNGEYDELKRRAKQFRLSAQIFDAFGKTVESIVEENLFVTTETDIDRQFDQAEARLRSAGIANKYLSLYADADGMIDCKIDVILFAASAECLERLENFARKKFHELNDAFRRKIAKRRESIQREYDRIVSDSDSITEHNFKLPETISVPRETDGREYADHLLVDRISRTARIKLNGWEESVLEAERHRKDFVCWIRNASRAAWALRVPYRLENNEVHEMFPDFLIVRRVEVEYVVDVLEPHDPTRRDNLGKARGLAEYAKKNPGVGRIELIREVDKSGQKYFKRLDMSKSALRKRVSRASTNNELDNIFDEYGEV